MSLNAVKDFADKFGGVFVSEVYADELSLVEEMWKKENLEGMPIWLVKPQIIRITRLAEITTGTATNNPKKTWSWNVEFVCLGDDSWSTKET